MKYRQCLIQKKVKDSLTTKEDTIWLPATYAKLYKTIQLEIEKDVWEDGWKIIGIYGAKDEEEINKQAEDYHKFTARRKE